MALQDEEKYKTVVFSDNYNQVHTNHSQSEGEATFSFFNLNFFYFLIEDSESSRVCVSDRSSCGSGKCEEQ